MWWYVVCVRARACVVSEDWCTASPRPSPQSVASDWVGRYLEDPCPAMAELVQFFFSSSGCKGQVDTEAFDDLDIASTTEDLSAPENFSEVQ